jgi:predicted nucleic acid-binding Zn ribbon protein
MRCENCNAENAAGAEYCAVCGEQLLYDEEFFKRENNVDALPKLPAKVKPIKPIKKDGLRARALIARRLMDALNETVEDEEDSESTETKAEAKKRKNAETAGAFLIVAVLVLVVALIFSRLICL